MKHYSVSGIFYLYVEAENEREAQAVSIRELSRKGVMGATIQVEEIRREGSAGSQGLY